MTALPGYLPLLATGSHHPVTEGVGCVLNAASFFDGDPTGGTHPTSIHPLLWLPLQWLNDMVCHHGVELGDPDDDGDLLLCPACSTVVYDAMLSVRGTGSLIVPRETALAWVQRILDRVEAVTNGSITQSGENPFPHAQARLSIASRSADSKQIEDELNRAVDFAMQALVRSGLAAEILEILSDFVAATGWVAQPTQKDLLLDWAATCTSIPPLDTPGNRWITQYREGTTPKE